MDNKNNVDRFSGFADLYDQYRPAPPEIITEILTNYLGKRPSLVVDLGCGTGLSTFSWKGHSDKIIGIDPNEDMLNKAIEKINSNENYNISFQYGYGNSTNLEGNSADIVTCSSAFQWMEPESTINEVLRVLKDDGIFATYSYDKPYIFDWKVEKAYNSLFYKVCLFLDENGEEADRVKLWAGNEYMEVMKKINKFRFMRTIPVHHRVKMNGEDFIGFVFSQGAMQTIKKRNAPQFKEEIERFIKLVRERLGDKEVEAIFSYTVRLAIK